MQFILILTIFLFIYPLGTQYGRCPCINISLHCAPPTDSSAPRRSLFWYWHLCLQGRLIITRASSGNDWWTWVHLFTLFWFNYTQNKRNRWKATILNNGIGVQHITGEFLPLGTLSGKGRWRNEVMTAMIGRRLRIWLLLVVVPRLGKCMYFCFMFWYFAIRWPSHLSPRQPDCNLSTLP